MAPKLIPAMLAGLVLLALSGCAEEGAGAPSVASSTAESSANPSPTVVGGRVGVPDEAKKHTRAGAEAFARYYFDMVNLSWQEGDPTYLDGLSEPDCAFCNFMKKKTGEMAASRRHSTAPPASVGRFDPRSGARTGEEYFTTTITQYAVDIVNPDGSVNHTQEAKSYPVDIGTVWSDSRWFFVDVEEAS